MGLIQKIINGIRGVEESYSNGDIDDNMTKDKYLRSLRRERRIQMEEQEKKMLLRKIEEYKQLKFKKYVMGFRPEKLKIENHMLKRGRF